MLYWLFVHSFCAFRFFFGFVLFVCFRLEKYRPQTFEDIVGNEDVISKFKTFSESGSIPNFILAGPPGVGKTTV